MQRPSLPFLLFLAVLLYSLQASSEPIAVTFINPGGPDGFWGSVTETMRAAAEDLDIEVTVVHTHRDRVAMLEAAKSLAMSESHPHYVILVNELKQGPLMMRYMKASGIKTFFLLNKLKPEESFVCEKKQQNWIVGSVIPDNEIAGYDMAVSLIEQSQIKQPDRPVRILALLGDSATPAALAREAGLRRAVSEFEQAELVRAFPVHWNRDEAKKRTHAALQQLDIDAIWGANDAIALGAIEAAQQLGRVAGEDLFVAGLNWSEEGINAVKARQFTMSHGGHFFAGAWSMVLLRDYHDGHFEGGHLMFPMSAVQFANAREFMQKLADRNWHHIDFRIFSKSYLSKADYDFSSQAILKAVDKQQSLSRVSALQNEP